MMYNNETTRRKEPWAQSNGNPAMTKLLRGIVHGRTIEVAEDLGLLDGQAVELIVMPSIPSESPAPNLRIQRASKELPGPPPGWRPGKPPTSAGLLADEWAEEDDKALNDIQADRTGARWRELPE
jgi:hypothetical protein